MVEALGRRGERRLGLKTIDLDSIVGTVDRSRRDFDRSFRPTSHRVRRRWQGIATAMRRGADMPPIDVYRVGQLHFVIDGHHRVSVARQLGLDKIDAMVTEILTEVDADQGISPRDLPLKSHQRLFFERVPLPPAARKRIAMSNGFDYAGLAEGVEAWGFRAMQARGEFMTREQVARAWFDGGVRAGHRDDARGRALRPRHRDRGLRARREPPLPAAAHPRLERRGHRAPCARSSTTRPATRTPSSTACAPT